VLERVGLQRLFDQPTRMILRNLARQPVRAVLTATGIASACAILIMGLFFRDSLAYIMHVQYGLAERADMAVSFIEPTSTAAIYELASLPGVRLAEPSRFVPVRLRLQHRRYDTAIQGILRAPTCAASSVPICAPFPSRVTASYSRSGSRGGWAPAPATASLSMCGKAGA
jgi:putative ABC transport system permease protein